MTLPSVALTTALNRRCRNEFQAMGILFAVGAAALVLRLAALRSLDRPYLAGARLLRPRLVTEKYRDPGLHPGDLRRQR